MFALYKVLCWLTTTILITLGAPITLIGRTLIALGASIMGWDRYQKFDEALTELKNECRDVYDRYPVTND